MNYIYNFNGYNIPISFNNKSNRLNLHGRWDLFEVKTGPFQREQIEGFIQSKKGWMNHHIKVYEQEMERIKLLLETGDYYLEPYNKEALRKELWKYVNKYQNERGKINKLTIRNDISRKWASCSSRRNLTFSHIVGYLPTHLVEYIVYHEMCHLTVMPHNSDFYDLMKIHYPDYKWYDNELNVYHYLICHKLHDEKIKKYSKNLLTGGDLNEQEKIVEGQ